MTFVEQYSLAMTRFFKENKDGLECLKEMLFYIRQPRPDTILGDMSKVVLTVGEASFRPLQIQGEWIIQIRDKSDKQIGELEYKDQFLIYCDDISKRTIAIEHTDGLVADINIYQILLDNY